MIIPHTKVEQNLIKTKTNILIGVDEAGRGPLAGPVVAGAVWVNPEIYSKKFEGRDLIRDSKTLSEKQRTLIFANIEVNKNFVFGIGEVSERMIDRMNILQGTFLAMRLAVEELINKLKVESISYFVPPSGTTKDRKFGSIIQNSKVNNICVLVDGNKKIPRVNHEQKIFSKGDQNIFSIAAASICAKVHRDRIMRSYHFKYPEYGFNSHKGYGTKQHMEQLEKHGPCKIHRKCFGPVKELL